MPRSGTSLVEQIAASHSRVFGGGERKDIFHTAEECSGKTAIGRSKNGTWTSRGGSRTGISPIYNERAARASRVTDKMPDNILHLGIIAVLFPAARVIFCRRDMRDTCLSCFFQRFGEGNAFAYDLADCGRRLLKSSGWPMHWRQVLPLSMLTVDYEALIADPEGESRRLIEFLGLDWESELPRLPSHRAAGLPRASLWQVRQPVSIAPLGAGGITPGIWSRS